MSNHEGRTGADSGLEDRGQVSVAGWDGQFGEYFAARAATLRSTAYLLCGDWHRAEDLVQTAMLRLYLAWPRLSRHDTLDGYARQVVVRTFLHENRRLWRRREQVTDQVPDLPDLGAPDGRDLTERLAVRAALAGVPPRQRAALVLRFWNDLSVEDTAAALGCSTGTVKSQTARGLAALRARLGDLAIGEAEERRGHA